MWSIHSSIGRNKDLGRVVFSLERGLWCGEIWGKMAGRRRLPGDKAL